MGETRQSRGWFKGAKHLNSRDPRKVAVVDALRVLNGLPRGRGRVTLLEETRYHFIGTVHTNNGEGRTLTAVPHDDVKGLGDAMTGTYNRNNYR